MVALCQTYFNFHEVTQTRMSEMYEDILKETSHRETNYPSGPWVATQLWKHLLFINYPIDVEAIKQVIPKNLQVDTYDGKAWITVLPFKIEDFTVRKFPLKGVDEFLELNVRTYVKRNGKPAIYFFSLDAERLLAVFGARFASLPYYHADMKLTIDKQSGGYHYVSQRKTDQDVVFDGVFKPSDNTHPVEGLAEWLADRYFLFSEVGDAILEGPIHHRPWHIADVKVNINKNGMLPSLPSRAILDEPYCFYAYQKRVLFWPFKKG